MIQTTPNDRALVRRRMAYAIARGIATTAAVFVVVVSVLLLLNYVQLTRTDPANARSIQQLMTAVREHPENETLRTTIRGMDLLARKALFSGLASSRYGALLLCGGGAVLLLALQAMALLARRIPKPSTCEGADDEVETNMLARWAVACLCILVGIAGLFLIMQTRQQLQRMFPATAAVDVPTAPAAPAYPSRAEVLSNWPNFRGPDNLGIAYCATAPTNWNAASGDGIVWKTVVPHRSFSSPVVWGNRIYLSGGDEKSGLYVTCFSATNGAVLWDTQVAATVKPDDRVGDDTGYAASTVATDGRNICAIFASGDLVCLAADGTRRWSSNLGAPDMNYGYASSLVIWRDRLLVQRDEGATGGFMAVQLETGKTLWSVPRDMNHAWSTPVLIEADGRAQAVLSADPCVIGYDIEAGKELWRIECMSGEVAPSPAFANGIVFAAQEGGGMKAFKPGSSNVLWEATDDVPDTSSPLALSNLVLMATSASAVITCFDGATSNILWRQEYDKGFYSSPVCAAGNIYAFDRDGVARIIKAARTYQPVAAVPMGEPVVTTPAFVGGRMFVRGTKHLFCIGDK